MAVFRTPVPVFDPIAFYQNGELGNESVLNRAGFGLDDKAQYLKENQDAEIARGSTLALVMGEAYDSAINSPTWNTPTNFAQGSDHHVAIQGLEDAVSTLNAASGSDTTRINNIDSFLLGESSVPPGAFPDWTDGATRTPKFLVTNDTHHQAIIRLDVAASDLSVISDDHETRITTNTSDLVVLTSQLVVAQGAISAQGTEIDLVSVLAGTNETDIASADSQIILIDGRVSTLEVDVPALDARVVILEAALPLVSVLADTNECFASQLVTQVDFLRARDHTGPLPALPAVVYTC